MEKRVCTGPCGRELPLTAFSPKRNRHAARCKECRAAEARAARSTPNPRELSRLT